MSNSFKDRADIWDKSSRRLIGAKKIADAIKKAIPLKKDMDIIDFGTGTGLLGFLIAPEVKQVHGVDTSSEMLEKLKEKNSDELFIKPYCQDIIKEPLTQKFDAVISSMTLHHIEDLKLFFKTIYNNLKESGSIAIADLVSEDGSFHSDNNGVFHFGFDKKELSLIVKEVGFKNIQFQIVNTINKPHRDFDIFLLSASK